VIGFSGDTSGIKCYGINRQGEKGKREKGKKAKGKSKLKFALLRSWV